MMELIHIIDNNNGSGYYNYGIQMIVLQAGDDIRIQTQGMKVRF